MTGTVVAGDAVNKAVGTCLILIEADQEETAHRRKCTIGDQISLVTDLIHVKVTFLEPDAEIEVLNPGYVFFDERSMNRSVTQAQKLPLAVYDLNAPDYVSGALNRAVATISVLFVEE
ncbi:hypothetical protein [Paragemmobacter ruber]|uniref:Uncharacterized protein n=1 Tax=Paragemmobacter ruber TaxID=1985673 RepID=A0ABW9Y811_9RHOB|nr:hypothetical protein [Rhodobacter ruber]NBE07987.1 hypothetical protein [Rhodobacter ruber]